MDGFSKLHLKDLGREERIIRVLHRNWFYLFGQFFWVLVIVGVFVGAFFAAPAFFPGILGGVDRAVFAFAQNFFMLAVWIYSFMIWVDYYFDIWIITSERVIDIEQKGLFSRNVSELRYSKIQDITTEVTGFLPSILNYGDVKIQTAGEEKEFMFRTISDPYAVKGVIMDLQRRSESDSMRQLGEMIKGK